MFFFSTTLIKNTAVTCPKPECSLGLYLPWAVPTFGEFVQPSCSYTVPFFSAKFPGGEARVTLIQLSQQQQDMAHIHLEHVLTHGENAELGKEEKVLFS